MKRHGTGQALVEFALVIPLFLIVVFGVLDLGRGVWAMDTAAHAASEATRFAIVHGGSVGTSCHVGTPVQPPVFISPTPTCPNPSPSKQMIYDSATSSAVASGGSVGRDGRICRDVLRGVASRLLHVDERGVDASEVNASAAQRQQDRQDEREFHNRLAGAPAAASDGGIALANAH